MHLYPPKHGQHSDFDGLLRESGGDGPVTVPGTGWGWAFALRHHNMLHGHVIVSAAVAPTPDQLLLLTVLAQQTATALSCAEMHRRDTTSARQLEDSNEAMQATLRRLQARTKVHEVFAGVLAAGSGEQGTADALHDLTALAVAIEDPFGNLRSWAGPGRPSRYAKPSRDRRAVLLRRLSLQSGAIRVGDRVEILVKPRAEILGLLALLDPDEQVTDHDMFALEYASTVLGLELSHQRHLAEMELNLRRELVDDLLAGTGEEGAYSRAEALGHDLRRPHYVVLVHSPAGVDSKGATAVARAASALGLNCLLGRHAGLVVLLTDGQPEPGKLHRAISRQLGSSTTVIGIGPRCDTPNEFPGSFDKARHTLNIRLKSATPHGASAYDELGFYRLVDAAHTTGAVEDFVREWLGALLDYDNSKSSELVHTLSEYLDCGGNYDESAATLHIHRSTLRYRLARIGELTGHDLRNVDTRFNLHAATRAWRFLSPGN
jgi:sugar diacid utilization regulator